MAEFVAGTSIAGGSQEHLERRAAVLGKPISHSLSPALHRAAYRALELTWWTYDALECDEAGLVGVLASAGAEVAGYSCTMPLKRVALQFATVVTDMAVAVGAANTLLPSDTGWVADNTDVYGIEAALAEAGVTTGGSVVILGAGGTAQATLAAVRSASAVTALVREPSRAGALLETAERLGVPVRIALLDDAGALTAADLIVSTLPGPAADPLAEHAWRRGQSMLDVVYHPWPTRLVAAAGAAGVTVVSGAVMLLHQAARQVELMTGCTAPVEAMRAALRQAAPGCGV